MARSGREQALLNGIAEKYGEFLRLGHTLMAAQDEEVSGVGAISRPLREAAEDNSSRISQVTAIFGVAGGRFCYKNH